MSVSTRRLIIVLFFVSIILVFFFPFRVESIHSTAYQTIFGATRRATPRVLYHNAFRESYVLVLQCFYYLSLVLLFVAKKRIWVLLSIASSGLSIISLLAIYVALTFYLHFSGPPKTMEAGIGFFALCLLNVGLLLFSFYTWFVFPKTVQKFNDSDLLDSDS
jgi:hypothetical protein